MEQEIKEIVINGVAYIPKDCITEVVTYTGEETIASRMIGKPVIVRSKNEGINVGIVVLADDTGVEIKGVRRLFYHKPKDPSLCWYEGVAMSGISDDSIVSGTVDGKTIMEAYSMTLLKMEIYDQILSIKQNEQG